MEIARANGQLNLVMSPAEPGTLMSASLGLFKLLYITECARTLTGEHITPVATSLPGPHELNAIRKVGLVHSSCENCSRGNGPVRKISFLNRPVDNIRRPDCIIHDSSLLHTSGL
ncbi:hypothetical protein OCA8868_01978 [Octadecabacter ascidiaceicola]|uniref:Uncharacterized protein n=1 Tax=Octadecabacter ascidiaceicola TaxID=1655543 RepID=A0A238K986_9RHOB|nr:hypothetical protein OCA8868_01978 [Octadecabacter ascidiaceicola]